MKHLFLALFAATLAALPAFADPKDDEIAKLKDEVALLRMECQALRKIMAEPDPATVLATNRVTVVVKEETTEAALLRLECQSLRKLLASPIFLPAPPDAQPSAVDSQTVLPPGFTFWLTVSTGIRHNATCAMYQKSTGRPCPQDEGRACRICGG